MLFQKRTKSTKIIINSFIVPPTKKKDTTNHERRRLKQERKDDNDEEERLEFEVVRILWNGLVKNGNKPSMILGQKSLSHVFPLIKESCFDIVEKELLKTAIQKFKWNSDASGTPSVFYVSNLLFYNLKVESINL